MQSDHLSFYYCCLVCISAVLARQIVQCGSNSKDTFLRLMDKLKVSLTQMLFLWPTLAGSLLFH